MKFVFFGALVAVGEVAILAGLWGSNVDVGFQPVGFSIVVALCLLLLGLWAGVPGERPGIVASVITYFFMCNQGRLGLGGWQAVGVFAGAAYVIYFGNLRWASSPPLEWKSVWKPIALQVAILVVVFAAVLWGVPFLFELFGASTP
jgi:hypothetical protein